MAPMHYLDYNASAPLKPAVREAVLEALTLTGNASSVHMAGRRARAVVEKARTQIATMTGVAPAQIVLTGGGAEANNMAIGGWRGAVFASVAAHDSVRACIGRPLIPVDHNGLVDPAALEAALAVAPAPALVSVILVNNETGVIQPMADIQAIARRFEAKIHVDAVQAAGKLPLDMQALGADLMSLSAHKIGGPQGVGALIIAAGTELAPLLRGGGQEQRRRAGTENVAGIAGFGQAATMIEKDLAQQDRLRIWRDGIEASIRAGSFSGIPAPDAIIAGAGAARAANTSCIIMPGIKGMAQVMALDLAGIAVGSGAACSSGKVAASHVLQAMGYDRELAGAAIRISLGWDSRWEDAEAVAQNWQMLYQRLRHPAGIRAGTP